MAIAVVEKSYRQGTDYCFYTLQLSSPLIPAHIAHWSRKIEIEMLILASFKQSEIEQ